MTKVFDVDVGDDELRLKVEAVGGGKEFAVLVDEGIAAIDEVLAGDHYWTLEGRAVSKTNYSQSSFDGYRGYIRCVRDLSADEVREFNNKD